MTGERDEPGTKQRRTRAALHAAVLELAADRDPTTLTVTEIAQRAGVHRSTVYEHAASPIDLLQRALLAELDAERAAHLTGLRPEDVPAALHDVTLGVFTHVERRAAIYRGIDDATGATLHALLADHFVESSRRLVADGVLVVPVEVPGLNPEAAREAALRYVADGVVGILGVWLATPPPRDPEVPRRLLEALQPAWWPRLG